MTTQVNSTVTGKRAAALIRLFGECCGRAEPIGEGDWKIIADGESDVRLVREAASGTVVAWLRHGADGHALETVGSRKLWVNGRLTRSGMLKCGDIIEIGQSGPIMRYRVYRDGRIPDRSTADALADCLDGARHAQGSLARRAKTAFGGVAHEFLARTTLLFRAAVFVLIVGLAAVIASLAEQGRHFEERLGQGAEEVRGLSRSIEMAEGRTASRDELAALRLEVADGISTTNERVSAVESRFTAVADVVSTASQSVIFLQGAYRYAEVSTGRVLRQSRLPSGGGSRLSFDGDGAPIELQFTGTGFIATDSGLIVTNRHVAEPWRDTDLTALASAMGAEPAFHRFVGFLPDRDRAFDVLTVAVSEGADVAILHCGGLDEVVKPLPIAETGAILGEEVVVLGYPTGVRAMLARSGAEFIAELRSAGVSDFWEIGERLARAGQVKPLATRGIIGQIAASAVVYDAETTHGGSGGPVLNLAGEVIAINTAILKEFDGSNLGVPVAQLKALLEEIDEQRGEITGKYTD
jgi:S1-C subfamily serine protease